MSTILKALQKLEQEKESTRPSGTTPVSSQPHSTTGGVAAWFLNPWAHRAVMGVIFIVLSGTAIHFYRQSRSQVPPHRGDRNPAIEKPATAYRKQPAPSAIPPIAKKEPNPAGIENRTRPGQSTAALPPPVPQTKSKPPGVNRNLQQPDRPPLSKTRQPQVQERPIQVPMTSDDPARHPNNIIRPPGPADMPAAEISVPSAHTREKETAPANPAQETKVVAEIKAPSDAYKDSPQLTDGRLKVHAIAWSPTAEERMAVVNNRVVYEGDSVGTFVVVAIRTDDVVVREKEKGLWKVAFGRP